MAFEIDDLLFQVPVNLPADTAVRPAGGNQSIKAGFAVGKIPFFQSSRRIVAKRTVRRFDPFCGNGAEISAQGFLVFLGACNEWCNR